MCQNIDILLLNNSTRMKQIELIFTDFLTQLNNNQFFWLNALCQNSKIIKLQT